MFTRADLGREVVIMNTREADYVHTGEIVKIIAVLGQFTINFENGRGARFNWRAESEADWRYISDEEGDVEYDLVRRFKPGDVVMVDKDYQTVKRGDNITILEVIDDERVTIEGCLPGGFIRIKDLIPNIDLALFRVATTDEVLIQYGVTFGRKKKLGSWYYKWAGISLDEAGCYQKGKGMFSPDGIAIPKGMIRKVSSPSPKATLVITGNNRPTSDSVKKLIGKSLKDLTTDGSNETVLRAYTVTDTYLFPGMETPLHANCLLVRGGAQEDQLPF